MLKRGARVIFIGPVGVGKTAITRRFHENTFNKTASTVGADVIAGEVVVDSKVIPLTLFDTAGAEQYRATNSIYYRDARCAVFVFDVSSEQSLAQLETFVPAVDDKCPDAIRFLVANKSDLEKRFDDFERKIQQMAATINAAVSMQTSALTSEGIPELFLEIATRLIHRTSVEMRTMEEEKPATMSLEANGEKLADENSCC
jgi:Ras-related protein Rab-1A